MDLTQVEKTLDERVRPRLKMDGGNVDVVRFDEGDGMLYVKLQGACGGCPMSAMTLKMGIESVLKEVHPEIKEVVQV